MGKNLVMGRKTFEKMPQLKGRKILVATTKKRLHGKTAYKDESTNTVAVYGYQYLNVWGDDIIICGGAEIYEGSIPECDEIYITHVKGSYEADTFFPITQKELDKIYPYRYFITSFEGGHQVIKYSKK